MAMWCHQHMLGDYKGRYRAGLWIKNDGKKKITINCFTPAAWWKKKGADKGGGFPPPSKSVLQNASPTAPFFSRFSDSAGKDLQSVWEKAPLTVPAAGQEVAKATLQLPGGVLLPPTQIRGLIPFLLLPRAKPVVTSAGVRPRQVFGPRQLCCGVFFVVVLTYPF